jgi:hypothetical protein
MYELLVAHLRGKKNSWPAINYQPLSLKTTHATKQKPILPFTYYNKYRTFCGAQNNMADNVKANGRCNVVYRP